MRTLDVAIVILGPKGRNERRALARDCRVRVLGVERRVVREQLRLYGLQLCYIILLVRRGRGRILRVCASAGRRMPKMERRVNARFCDRSPSRRRLRRTCPLRIRDVSG